MYGKHFIFIIKKKSCNYHTIKAVLFYLLGHVRELILIRISTVCLHFHSDYYIIFVNICIVPVVLCLPIYFNGVVDFLNESANVTRSNFSKF